MATPETYTCPFCGFRDTSDYQLLLHVEIQHSEDGDSPFAVRDSLAASSVGPSVAAPVSTPSILPVPPPITDDYVDCPYKCGERIAAAELQSHTDFHLAEDMTIEESTIASGVEPLTGVVDDEQTIRNLSNGFSASIPDSIRNRNHLDSDSSTGHARRKSASLRELFFGPSSRKRGNTKSTTSEPGKIKRLGTAELGPYAHEKRMPAWLQQMLEEGAKVTISNRISPNGTLVRVETIANETSNLVPVLARLSLLDRTVARAFYCSPEVRHIAKMPREGGFCGYRNIQMLVSYIRGSEAPNHARHFARSPSIIKLQDMIENAWDLGYNSTGRIETGGIRLTRKYIGTPEAQALFLSLGIPCEAVAYSSRAGTDAYTTLMSAIFNYFEDDSTRHDDHRVFITDKPPIYFQHPGHSMTIVGVEVHKNGAANLVVFDPMFNPSATLKRLVGATSFRCSEPGRLMRAHRRGESYLSKYKDFELLKIPCHNSKGWMYRAAES